MFVLHLISQFAAGKQEAMRPHRMILRRSRDVAAEGNYALSTPKESTPHRYDLSNPTVNPA